LNFWCCVGSHPCTNLMIRVWSSWLYCLRTTSCVSHPIALNVLFGNSSNFSQRSPRY
jgi:hypothetical protein